jgi:hypothetical protein
VVFFGDGCDFGGCFFFAPGSRSDFFFFSCATATLPAASRIPKPAAARPVIQCRFIDPSPEEGAGVPGQFLNRPAAAWP